MENIITELGKKGWRIKLVEDYNGFNEYLCSACFDPVNGTPAYYVQNGWNENGLVHKSCLEELPGNIQHHPLHPHHLLTPHISSYGFICDGCGTIFSGLNYRCQDCKFQLDVSCATDVQSKIWKQREETYRLYHPHKLRLFYSYSKQIFDEVDKCCCCLKAYRHPSYTCPTCLGQKGFPFIIHKSCLDSLPHQVRSPFLHKHTLSIRNFPTDYVHPFRCDACFSPILHVGLRCIECPGWKIFHVSCGTRKRSGMLFNFHEHKLYYYTFDSWGKMCMLCEDECRDFVYKCEVCPGIVHMRCIPIPEMVEHESHCYHPLKLTNSIVTHREGEEYRCDVCEELGDVADHSYYCHECNYIAHIECIYPDLEGARVDKSKAEENNEDGKGKGKGKVETDDDAEENDNISTLEDDSRAVSGSDSDYGEDGEIFKVHSGMLNIKTKMKDLVGQLEGNAHFSMEMHGFKEDMVALVFKLDDLAATLNKMSKK